MEGRKGEGGREGWKEGRKEGRNHFNATIFSIDLTESLSTSILLKLMVNPMSAPSTS
jgi:hypothetical protein